MLIYQYYCFISYYTTYIWALASPDLPAQLGVDLHAYVAHD